MISDLNGSLWSRQFLNVANKRTCFTSCACAFKGPFLSEILCAPGSFYIYEKYAIFFEVVELLLHLLQSS